MRSVPRLCEFNPGICLTTEEKLSKKTHYKAHLKWYNNNRGNSTVNFCKIEKYFTYLYISLLEFNIENKKSSQVKVIPQQAEVAHCVPGRLRPRIFLTFRHYKGGRSSAKRTGRLYPRRNTWYSLSEAESTSGHMVLSGEPRKKSPVTPPGMDPGTVRLVAQSLNHYATPGPTESIVRLIISTARRN